MLLLRTILFLRFKQALRIVQEMEAGRVLFLLPVVIAIGYWPVKFSAVPEAQLMVAGGWLLVLVGIHRKRGDVQFLQLASQRARQVMTLEYAAMSLPLLVLLIAFSGWMAAGAVAVGIPVVTLIPPSKKRHTLRKTIALPFAPYDFEWRSGFRQQWLAIVAIEAGALALSHYPFLPLLALLGMAMLAASFYQQCESSAMVAGTGLTAKTFLKFKIQRGLLWFVPLTIPLVIACIWSAPYLWPVVLFASVFSAAVVAFSIVLKYSHFASGTNTSANGMTVAIFSAGGLIPFLLPIPILMFIREWPAALKNLSTYLHASAE